MFLENLSPKYLLALINQYYTYILHSGFETPQRPHNTYCVHGGWRAQEKEAMPNLKHLNSYCTLKSFFPKIDNF